MIESKGMIDTLQTKPVIGIIGGFTCAIFASIKTFLTNDAVLSTVSTCGIWIGFLIALLTLAIKVVELSRLLGGWTLKLRGWFTKRRKK